MPLDARGYDVILADPPWHYNYNKGRGASRYYSTATTEDICRLIPPVSRDAVLFIWACWPRLPDAMKVITAWGFEYMTMAFVWVKANKSGIGFFTGMGNYTRANTEPCLLAIRGNMKTPDNRSIQALIYAPVRAHSKKPDDQYRKIEALYPKGRYLEMFARRARPGWDAFGNEAPNSIKLEGA